MPDLRGQPLRPRFKHAHERLSTRAVAAEYGKAGIHLQRGLCPGGVETDLMTTTGRATAESSGLDLRGNSSQLYANETAHWAPGGRSRKVAGTGRIPGHRSGPEAFTGQT